MSARQVYSASGIFYDSSNLESFKKWFEAGILGGATTNPLILQKEGVLDLPGHISKMIKIAGPGFPISIEVPDSEMTTEEMVTLGLDYHRKFPENAVIKIPMDPRDQQKCFAAMYRLGQRGVRVNATLGLSTGQLIGAAEALRDSEALGDNYISLFWARREEAMDQTVKKMIKGGFKKSEAIEKVPDAAETLRIVIKYLDSHDLPLRVIVGSIRRTDQIDKAFCLGADIVTITPPLIQEWMHTKRGVETADEFNQAYRSIKDKFKLI